MSKEARQGAVLEREQPRGLPARFAGKVALVTGASDRGIGGAIAERLAREGATISILTRDKPSMLLRRLKDLAPGLQCTLGDVCTPDDVSGAIDATMEEFGQIDVLINNAGIEAAQPFETLSEERWQQVLDVNLTGVMRMTRAALPHLPDGAGAIVNVASVVGIAGTPGMAAYAASKAGVIGMTQSLALELAPRGIRVVAVAPAMVKTPMSSRYAGAMTEAVWERVQAAHPLGVGLPQDVGAAVAFLASQEARWITGVTLPMGWSPSFPLPIIDLVE